MTPIFMVGEVLVECMIPFITAGLVNAIRAGCELETIGRYGLMLLGMAGLALRRKRA